MDVFVFWAVLGAGALHAGWNAVIKSGLDRFSSLLILSLVQSGIALLLIPLFPLPAAPAWACVVASAALHTGYKISLLRAYEHGELSQVYPLARGTAPLVVALVATLFFGEHAGPAKLAGIVAIGIGVILMSMKGGAGFRSLSPQALGYALCTALFTASYSIVDGIGARLAGTASGFIMFMFVGDGVLMSLYAVLARRSNYFQKILPAWREGLLSGAMSLASYWIVVWAFTQAPLAIVAALRETSVLFAMLFGLLILKEEALHWRWAAAILIVVGIALLRI
jgi:uncharacterized membrane protein